MTRNKNIYLENTAIELPYKSRRRGGDNYYNWSDPMKHAAKLKKQLKKIRHTTYRIKDNRGTYLKFSSKPGHELTIDRLENLRKGIRLLNVKRTGGKNKEVTTAVVFVPKGKENYFINKVRDFINEKTPKGKPKNNDFVISIDKISEAFVEALWTGKKEEIPLDDSYCEIWLRFNGSKDPKKNRNNIEKALADFKKGCEKSGIKICKKEIDFPERIVKLVYANKDKLTKLLRFSSVVAELRRAPIVSNFFTELKGKDQQEWVNDLLERTKFKSSDKVAVCILDTGVYSKHPLLKKAIKSTQSVDDSWNLNDMVGHGTQVAGVVLYDDFRKIIANSSTVIIKHNIDSVKILPDKNSSPENNDPELYGDITHQAVSKSEISDPGVKSRIICMAVTAGDYNTDDGSPTSWSAELDQITSGVGEQDSRRMLFLVSAGNTESKEVSQLGFPDANLIHQVENPGQSWNSITVGAYTSENDVTLSSINNKNFYPVSPANSLSPFSSTSVKWEKRWPIKPDILLDGGNMMSNGIDVDYTEDLELLTSNNKLVNPLATISGTSSAVAQASYMAAVLSAEYPEYWPETIRALLIHSADWTHQMLKEFCPNNSKRSIRQLLRTCGYGIPNLDKAKYSTDNSVNLIIQDEIQPFDKKGMHEMKLHSLPWPSEALEKLVNNKAKLKVTLSYFIEPGPGQVGWKNKYRYPSAGLRFDVNRSNETEEEFKERIDVAIRNPENPESEDYGNGKKRDWYIGSKTRDVGSIHSDYIESSAIDLSDVTKIAVYPVAGWWKERKYLGKVESKMRYSLIVSIETPSTNVNLYNEIQNKIRIANQIQI